MELNRFPLVSIITPTFNSEKTFEQTLKSIENQSYKNIEYIVIDGASTDKTLEIAKQYEHIITKIISEKDNGIYDAFNKGIKVANGDLIAILNSDDYYYDSKVIESIVNAYKNNVFDVLYSNMIVVDGTNANLKRLKKADISLMKENMSINHPTIFVKKEIYDNYNYNLEYKIAADYDLFLKLYLKEDIKFFYLDSILTVMANDGASSNSNVHNEKYRIHKDYFNKYYAMYILSKHLIPVKFRNLRRKIIKNILPNNIYESMRKIWWKIKF